MISKQFGVRISTTRIIALHLAILLATPDRATPQAAPATAPAPTNAVGEIVLNFAKAPVGKPYPSWRVGTVTFTLASAPQLSKAQPRVMFFPHLKTDRHGILNAMANEQAIPVKAEITGGADSVTVVLWGTIGCHAWLEAHDKNGKLLDRAALPNTVPERTSPSDPIPSFELSVKAQDIAYILFGGAHNGGALVADEMRVTPTSH
ncbi:MAG TPA: hypothetical protein VIM11_16825 [Tepidisphaeraceae bacterium]|jgi:hypothetical protein